MAERCPQQIPNRDSRQAVLLAPGFEAHQIALVDVNLGRILDQDDAILVVDEECQGVQHGRLAGSGAAADQDVFSVGD